MPRYQIDQLDNEVSLTNAVNALAAKTDEFLVSVITPRMVPTIPALAWNVDEPENDSLAQQIRDQLNRDLYVLHRGDGDPWCDEWLALGYSDRTSRTYLSVLYPDDDTDIEMYRYNNPVIRLRASGICNKPDENAVLAIHLDMPPQYITATDPIYQWATTTNGIGYTSGGLRADNTAF